MEDKLTSRSDLIQALSWSLTVPHQQEMWGAVKQDLLPGLAAWNKAFGLGLKTELGELSSTFDQFPSHYEYLVAYSRLFLVPPIEVSLNIGTYLDGTLYGPSVQSLEDLYRTHGLETGNDTKDLPDHFPTMLEFLSTLLDGSETPEKNETIQKIRSDYFLRVFPIMAARLIEAENHFQFPPYYSRLIQLTAQIIRDEKNKLFPPLPEKPTASPQEKPIPETPSSPVDFVLCALCQAPIAPKDDLDIIRARLAEAGLPADQLAYCLNCRGPLSEA